MQKSLQLQKTLKRQLDQAVSNYKKTGESRRTVGYLNGRIEAIQGIWKEFQDNHRAICSCDEDDSESDKAVEQYKLGSQYGDFEASYFEFLGELQDEVGKKISHNAASSPPERKTEIKLPRIELPRFDGDYTKWRTFHDLFVTLIHNDTTIPLVQKLQYLKANLAGEPERILRQYDVTGNNYNAAWAVLVKRYNNKRFLVSTHLKALFSQATVKGESVKEIKDLLDRTRECLHELSALGVSTNNWDPIILHMLTQRLPNESRTLWEQKISDSDELPELEQMYSFLEGRFRALEAIGQVRSTHTSQDRHTKANTSTYHAKEQSACVMCKGPHDISECKKFIRQNSTVRRQILLRHKFCVACLQRHTGSCPTLKHCTMCRGDHILQKCTQFQGLQINQRQEFVAKHKLCSNCLKVHRKEACPNRNGCFKCSKRHHTWLHTENTANISKTDTTQPQSEVQPLIANASSNCNYNQNSTQALLATAVVYAEGPDGSRLPLRALVDLGSQSSFITQTAVQALKLKGTPTSLHITGLGSTKVGKSTKQAALTIRSATDEKFSLPLKAYVLNKITSVAPMHKSMSADLAHFKKLPLADPNFKRGGKIDLLLGAGVYAKILCDGIRKGSLGSPIAQSTKLGWIIFGEIKSPPLPQGKELNFIATEDDENETSKLDNQLRKFWDWEEINPQRKFTAEEEACEQFFSDTHKRLENGNYQVRLPFKDHVCPKLGDSKNMAIKRFLHLEKRLHNDHRLYTEYRQCIEEYLEMGHMSPVMNEDHDKQRYYLPHHAVIKESTTTKLRVVFDASAKSSNGLSLNEQLMTGPTIQPKLYSTLLRWRTYRYAVTADIEKMYRMIKMHPDDRQYQTIIWRNQPNEKFTEYELNTVTFGTTSAPYLAIKTLQQLASDDKHLFLTGARVAQDNFYVDDLLAGADTIADTITLQNEIIQLLQGGGFRLRKWAANEEQLLNHIPLSDRELELPLRIEDENQIKALGIQWHPATDDFSLVFKSAEFRADATTKRKIVSQIAKLFDPLGWIAPIIIVAKILIQQLWLSGCSWDEEVPEKFAEEWRQFKEQLSTIQQIKIPRWIKTTHTQSHCELHGFCDASTSAYAAVVYMRVANVNKNICTTLITAKTRVAPTKPITLPRLELCGAVLLSKLMTRIKEDINMKQIRSYCWSDSKIVLSWLKGLPNKWRTYVANRVAEIQDNNLNNSWNYVPTKHNPADLASRGVTPANLIHSTLWWSGPDWLQKNPDHWPQEKCEETTSLEAKASKVLLTMENQSTFTLHTKFSSFKRMLHVTAYCLRFLQNCQNKNEKICGNLKVSELERAKCALIKIAQREIHAQEIQQLKCSQQISKQSHLLTLRPFLDKNSLIRVGGRLENSKLPFNMKHPKQKLENHFQQNNKYYVEYRKCLDEYSTIRRMNPKSGSRQTNKNENITKGNWPNNDNFHPESEQWRSKREHINKAGISQQRSDKIWRREWNNNKTKSENGVTLSNSINAVFRKCSIHSKKHNSNNSGHHMNNNDCKNEKQSNITASIFQTGKVKSVKVTPVPVIGTGRVGPKQVSRPQVSIRSVEKISGQPLLPSLNLQGKDHKGKMNFKQNNFYKTSSAQSNNQDYPKSIITIHKNKTNLYKAPISQVQTIVPATLNYPQGQIKTKRNQQIPKFILSQNTSSAPPIQSSAVGLLSMRSGKRPPTLGKNLELTNSPAIIDNTKILNSWRGIQHAKQQCLKRWKDKYRNQHKTSQNWDTTRPNLKIGQVVSITNKEQPPRTWPERKFKKTAARNYAGNVHIKHKQHLN